MTTDGPTADLVAQVRHHSRLVIDAEVRRLTRRVPSLRRTDLDVIDAVLTELADSLLVARLRSVQPDIAPMLRQLFDTQRVEA